MTDVFISYASEDKERVAPLVKALESHGLNVWWDRNIQPGQSFSDVIEEALNQCRCVIVVWTPNAVQSRWVNAEAAEGANQGILIPILLEETKIPLEFRRIHTAQLIDWKGDTKNEEVSRIVAAIRNVIGALDTSTTTLNKSEQEAVENQSITSPEVVYGKSYSIFPFKFLHMFYKSVPYVVGFLLLAFIIWFYGPLIQIGDQRLLAGSLTRLLTIVLLGISCSVILYLYLPARRLFTNSTSFYLLHFIIFSFLVGFMFLEFAKDKVRAPLLEQLEIQKSRND